MLWQLLLLYSISVITVCIIATIVIRLIVQALDSADLGHEINLNNSNHTRNNTTIMNSTNNNHRSLPGA